MKFRYTRPAERDIAAIGAFIAKENPARSISFVRELRNHCQALSEAPLAYPIQYDLGENIRRSVFGIYLIFYRVSDTVLEIRRIIHGARDIGSLS